MPYICWNAAAPTTAAMVPVATGTAIKTMLQIATPSTRQIQLISWGYNLSATPSSGIIELLQTDVAATVTAHVASGIQPLDPNGTASLCVGGTALTGYTATAEGTITATRSFDTVNLVSSGSAAAESLNHRYQWMPNEQPIIAVSKFLRVRVTLASTVNMSCYVVFDEVG